MFLYVYLESEIYNTKTILLDFKKKTANRYNSC